MSTTLPPICWNSEPGTYVACREPVLMCADCLRPFSDHYDGICADGEGEGYRFLPLGRFAGRVVRDVAGSWGSHLYVFTLGGGWEPPCYTVRGDTFQDAWEWFMDYCAARDLLDDRTEYLDDDERAAWERGAGLDWLEMVDGYPGLYDVSDVNGWEIR